MVIHPHDPEVVYIVPLESDGFRVTPDGKLRVYRTRDGGRSWEPLVNGLPQEQAYETVLRDGMAADALDPAGVYFGTRSGKLFGSPDGGTSWRALADGLPPIVCVKAAVIGDPKKVRLARTKAGPRKALAKKTASRKKVERKTASRKKVAKKSPPRRRA